MECNLEVVCALTYAKRFRVELFFVRAVIQLDLEPVSTVWHQIKIVYQPWTGQHLRPDINCKGKLSSVMKRQLIN